jgi:hypothetical protein
VAEVLHDTGLAPALLELEVTESAVMEDPEVALEQLHRLRELGVTLAIDDFRHRLFLAAAPQAPAGAEAEDRPGLRRRPAASTMTTSPSCG